MPLWDKRLCVCVIFSGIFLTAASSNLQNSDSEKIVQQLLKTNNDKARNAILQANKQQLDNELTSALVAAGKRLILSAKYDSALAAYKSAELISIKLNDLAGKSTALRGIGRVYSFLSKDVQAMKYFQDAYDLSEKINDLPGKAEALRLISGIHQIHGNSEEEMKCLQESLRIEESIQNRIGIAQTLYWIAVSHVEGEQQELGFQELNKTLSLAEEAEDAITAARALNSLGVYYDYRGNYDTAMDYYNRAEELNRTSGNIPGLTNNLHNIATVFHSKGNYVEALRFHLESLKLREKLKNPRAVAISLNQIGTVFADQGEYPLAIQYLNRSYRTLATSNDPAWSADVLSNIGAVYNLAGEPDKAIQYFQRSLREGQKINDPGGTADTVYSLARAYQLKNDFKKARELYQLALKNLESAPRISMKTILLLGSASTEYELGNFQESIQLADEAIQLAKADEFQEQLWSALLCKAKSCLSLHRKDEARKALEESIQILEAQRQQVSGGEEMKQRYLESRTEPYALLIELLVGEAKKDQAFEYAERAKARVLVDVMQKGKINVSRVMTNAEKMEEAKLKENLYLLNVQFEEANSLDTPDRALINTLKIKLEKSRLDYEAFQNKLYAIHPELKVQRGEAEIKTLEKARALLPNEETAFLEYVISRNKSFVYLITRSETEVHELNLSQDNLKSQVSAFRKQISKRDPGFQKNAKQLYNSLLAPVHSRLEKISHVIIIPDGILWELPFQALVSEQGEYLLQNIAVSYGPSVTALSEMKKIRQQKAGPSTILAFANPAIGKETAEKMKVLFRGEGLHSLPESEIEVKKLAELYGSDRAAIYTGSEASESVLKKEMGKHDIIHLATHGILNESSPMYSHLLFARSGNTDPEDGLLEAWEIMNMNLKARLVILSACETARGKISAGEGIIGLNWAFFVAGCPTTVVSQWKVESSSTAELMFRFHQNMQDSGFSPPKALQQAALEILKNPDYHHPFYWAGFIIVGDPS